MSTALAAATPPPGHFVVTEFAQLQEPADALMAGYVIAVEFESDRHLHRRGLDFLSGLAYGLGASMEKLTDGLYRLVPAH